MQSFKHALTGAATAVLLAILLAVAFVVWPGGTTQMFP